MLTDLEKQIIRVGKEENISWETLSRMLGKSPDAVRMSFKRMNDVQKLGEKVRYSHRKVNPIIERAVERVIVETPKISIRDAAAQMGNFLPPEVSPPSYSTIQRILKRRRLTKVKCLKKTFISAKNQKKQLEYAKEYLEKWDYYFDLVIWSDETMVRQSPQGQELHVWVRHGKQNEEMPVNGQLQQGGFGVMFWGCFSKFGFGPLVVVNGSMNAEKYLKILKEDLLPTLRQAKTDLGMDMVFMQDNAPCHKAKTVMRFLEDQKIETLNWPPQSPDLNPIENLWAIIKQKRKKKFGMPSSKDELIDQVFDIWNNLDNELAEVLADSAKNRLRLCLAREGRQTGY